MRFVPMLFFASPAAIDPPSLILSPAEAARQRAERRERIRQARSATAALLRRLRGPEGR